MICTLELDRFWAILIWYNPIEFERIWAIELTAEGSPILSDVYLIESHRIWAIELHETLGDFERIWANSL